MSNTEQVNKGKVRIPNVAFYCPECNRSWSVFDDPNEWAYGHECCEEE